MSEEPAETTASTSAACSEKRRSTVPEILPHQRSFEKRYSHIINKKILETSINMEALQRQMHAYFPMSRSSSMNKEGNGGSNDDGGDLSEKALLSEESHEEDTKEKTSSTEGADLELRKMLEKMATVDIAKIGDSVVDTNVSKLLK